MDENSSIVVTPFMVAWKTAFTFESFNKLRGSKLVGAFFDIGIINMFFIMAAAYYVLVTNFLRNLQTGEHVGVVAPIIPGVTIGLKTFMYIIPGLVVAALLHEAFHALAARYEGIRVRSTGLMLFLGFIPAAFVEPDEDMLKDAPTRSKLRIFAAGVLANTILFAVFSMALLWVTSSGYYIAISVAPGGVAYRAGLPETIIVDKIVVNGTEFTSLQQFIEYVSSLRKEHGGSLRGVPLAIEFHTVDGKVYRVYKPADEKAIGIYLYMVPRRLAALGPGLALTAFLVLYYAQAINIGLAGINAIPLFITDGAQFLHALFAKRTSEENARKMVAFASAVTLALLLPNIAI
jgi:hypothetical protein